MQVDRLEFLGALEKVKAGLSTRAMIEQTDHFCFQDDMVYTYNDSISVSCSLELSGIEGAVNAESLLKLLKRLRTKSVSVSIGDDNMIIKSGKTKEATLALCDITLTMKGCREVDEEEDLPSDFVSALSRCVHSASKDVTRPILTCVHFGNGCLYASDGKQMTRYIFDDEHEQEFNIPASTVRALIKFDPKIVVLDETWIHFTDSEGIILSIRGMEGDYPTDKCDSLIDSGEYDEIDFPVDILDVLTRAEVFSKDGVTNFGFVTVGLEEGKTTITSSNEYGGYKEELKNVYDGPDLMFSFPPGMLLGVAEDDIASVGVGNNKIIIETEDYSHVISLRRG